MTSYTKSGGSLNPHTNKEWGSYHCNYPNEKGCENTIGDSGNPICKWMKDTINEDNIYFLKAHCRKAQYSSRNRAVAK
jgi:hypothetical protein